VPHKSLKENPKHLNFPLVAGCSLGDKPSLLHVIKWDAKETRKIIRLLIIRL